MTLGIRHELAYASMECKNRQMHALVLAGLSPNQVIYFAQHINLVNDECFAIFHLQPRQCRCEIEIVENASENETLMHIVVVVLNVTPREGREQVPNAWRTRNQSAELGAFNQGAPTSECSMKKTRV